MKKLGILFFVIVIVFVMGTGCQNSADSQTELDEAKTKIKELEDQINTLESLIAKDNQNEEQNSEDPIGNSYIMTAMVVMKAISDRDFDAVAQFVHPDMGIRFTPYPHIDETNDLVFTKDQISKVDADTTVYKWGAFDGSGEPIEMTFSDYYDRFIYDEDFLNFEMLGNNEILMTGNTLNNQFEVYSDAKFLDYHFPGIEEQYAGMDWKTLRLVFEEVSGTWYLVGIVHGEWTI